MENIKIPSHFTVIQNREFILEFKSQYHYWRITQSYEIFVLAHKYRVSDAYHKQRIGSDPNSLIRYIIRHDTAFGRRLKSQFR